MGPLVFVSWLLCVIPTAAGNASGITSPVGEQCLVTGASGVHLEPCLESIAAGDGREVLQQDEASRFTKAFVSEPAAFALIGHLIPGRPID